MSFNQHFQKYSFPKLGYVRIPRVQTTLEEKRELGLLSSCSSDEYLCALAKHWFDNKLKINKIPQDKKEQYYERLEHELSEITKLMFSDYILLVYSIIVFCKKNGIPNGPSRGSGGSSLLLYVLGITQIDPIKHDLLFERFISSTRADVKEFDNEKYLATASLPDIDMDSANSLKYKINKFIEELFPGRTASILTFGTLQGKVVIKECLKVIEEMPEEDAKKVANIIETNFGKVETIEGALENNEEFKEWAKNHKTTVEVACKLNKLIKNTSVHASGVLVTDEQLCDCVPIQTAIDKITQEKKIVTSYNMGYSQRFGVKIDNLGLKNLGIIQDCCNLINKKMDEIDVNDLSIYQYLNLSNCFYGIFQAEEGLGKQVLKKIAPKGIEDITVSVALGRPGQLSLIDDFVKADNQEVLKLDPRVKSILEPTRGYIVYQETIMKLAQVMANFTPQEANELRKGIGKKKREIVEKFKDKFINNSIKNEFDKEFINWCWKIFNASADYSFVKSHACGYAYLTAITAYLKANHPKEFFYSLLKNVKHEQKPIEEIQKINTELPQFQIKLLPPSLLSSGFDFTIEEDGIRVGLGNIKGVSEKIIKKLESFRPVNCNKFQIFKAANEAKLSIGTISSIIQCGTLELPNQSRSKTVYEAQVWNLLKDKEKQYCLQLGEQHNFDIVRLVGLLNKEIKDEKGKPIIKDSRLQTIKKHAKPYKEIYQQNHKNEDLANYWYERTLTGCVFSKSLKSIFSSKRPGLITIKEARDTRENSRVIFVGFVDMCYRAMSKNGKTRYMKMDISDETDQISVLLFNEKIDQCKGLNRVYPKEGDCVIVRGNRKNDAVFADVVSTQEFAVYIKLSDLPDKNNDKEDDKKELPENKKFIDNSEIKELTEH